MDRRIESHKSCVASADVLHFKQRRGADVTWQSVTGVTYYVQSSTNLGGQSAFTSIQSNIVGQTGSTSYTDPAGNNGNLLFYRVGVQ